MSVEVELLLPMPNLVDDIISVLDEHAKKSQPNTRNMLLAVAELAEAHVSAAAFLSSGAKNLCERRHWSSANDEQRRQLATELAALLTHVQNRPWHCGCGGCPSLWRDLARAYVLVCTLSSTVRLVVVLRCKSALIYYRFRLPRSQTLSASL